MPWTAKQTRFMFARHPRIAAKAAAEGHLDHVKPPVKTHKKRPKRKEPAVSMA